MLRVLQLVLTVFMSSAIVLIAANTLSSVIASGSVRSLAAVIDRNQTYRQYLVTRGDTFDYSVWMDPSVLSTVAQFADPQRYASDCLSDASRASVTVELGLLDQALLAETSDHSLRALVAQAAQAIAQRLKCSPVDGNAWLLRARIAEIELNDISVINTYLDLSYLYAPAEKWVMLPRLRFVDYLLDRNRIAAPPAFGADLQRFASLSKPSEVAELYSDGANLSRALMRLTIDTQRLDRRVRILRDIDALGVSYPVPESCIPPVDHTIPGSELGIRRPADLIEACAR